MRGSTFMNNTWLLVTLSLPPQAACIQDFIPQSGKHCFYSHSTGQNSDIWLNVTGQLGGTVKLYVQEEEEMDLPE